MFAILGIVLCCAAISLVVGAVAFLGLSKKDKTPTDQETALPQEERN